MSEFEFVQVTIAIILGLGITAILRNIGEQIRRRSEIQMYSLQLASCCLLILVILRYLWTFWSTLEVSWNLPLFLLAVSSPIALALSAQVISVDCDSTMSPEHQYFENCRATYLFWASAPLFGVFFDAVSGIENSLLNVGFRFLVIVLLGSLAFTKRPSYHWFVLLFLFITLVGGMSRTQFALTN